MNPDAELYMTALKMFSALGAVLIVLLKVLHILKKHMKHNGGTGGSRGIRILDSRHLSAKSNIALVEIPGKILVVGVGQEHICLLDKIENPEQINEIKSAESLKRQAPFAGQFHRIFSELMKKKRFE